MSKAKRVWAFFLVLALCVCALAVSAGAASGAWKADKTGWWYENADGSYPQGEWQQIDGKWYFFGGDGYMRTGWLYDDLDGAWYYLGGSGAMQTGWVFDGGKWYHMSASGKMQTGWVYDAGSWYYMNPYGVMQTGWVYDGDFWYYMNAAGAMQTGWIYDGGSWFYMSSAGAMATGWVYDGGSWYYMKDSGAMQTGWMFDKGDWYWFYPSGVMAANTTVDGYTFDASGLLVYTGEPTEVYVSTVDELIAAIGSNTVIHLAPGVYDLAEAGDYRTGEGEFYYWAGPQLFIRYVRNLSIIGEDKETTRIVSESTGAEVLWIEDAKNVTLSGFTMGHEVQSLGCSAGVLYLAGSEGIVVDGCGMFGCGTIGVTSNNCKKLTVKNCEIYQCSGMAVDIYDSWGAEFIDNDIHDCAWPTYIVSFSKDVTIDGVKLEEKPVQSRVYGPQMEEEAEIRATGYAVDWYSLDIPEAGPYVGANGETIDEPEYGTGPIVA